eukprot:3150496-Rhodomonas_salina.2
MSAVRKSFRGDSGQGQGVKRGGFDARLREGGGMRGLEVKTRGSLDVKTRGLLDVKTRGSLDVKARGAKPTWRGVSSSSGASGAGAGAGAGGRPMKATKAFGARTAGGKISSSVSNGSNGTKQKRLGGGHDTSPDRSRVRTLDPRPQTLDPRLWALSTLDPRP